MIDSDSSPVVDVENVCTLFVRPFSDCIPPTNPRVVVDTHCVPVPVVCSMYPLLPDDEFESYIAPVTARLPATDSF